VSADRRIAADLWPLYRHDPGNSTYQLDGKPIGGQTHAASYVAAAAAAKAADEDKASDELLDQAQDADSSNPTYYGAAWVALGRVMLTSSALGACPD
jgi:endoglucanase